MKSDKHDVVVNELEEVLEQVSSESGFETSSDDLDFDTIDLELNKQQNQSVKVITEKERVRAQIFEVLVEDYDFEKMDFSTNM